MKIDSLNKLAWRKFKKNKLAFFSLLYLLFCLFISVFAVPFLPDNTPMANNMNIELATLPPLSKITFLKIPKSKNPESSYISSFFLGKELNYDKISISSYQKLDNGIIYSPYASKIEKVFYGKYYIDKQIFFLGTDKYGRDLLSRLVYATRISFAIGFISVFISLILGLILGLTAGYYRGIVDDIIMWFVNVMWSIPTLMLVIAITLALGKGFWQVFVAVGLTMWVEVARIVRGQVLLIRELEFVQAANILGLKESRVIFKHILPNISGPIIVISAINFAAAILIEAGLSFLGVGAQPPMPSWGSMIKYHYAFIVMQKEYLAILPGLAIMFSVLSFTLLGNGLRDAFDVKE